MLFRRACGVPGLILLAPGGTPTSTQSTQPLPHCLSAASLWSRRALNNTIIPRLWFPPPPPTPPPQPLHSLLLIPSLNIEIYTLSHIIVSWQNSPLMIYMISTIRTHTWTDISDMRLTVCVGGGRLEPTAVSHHRLIICLNPSLFTSNLVSSIVDLCQAFAQRETNYSTEDFIYHDFLRTMVLSKELKGLVAQISQQRGDFTNRTLKVIVPSDTSG